MMGGQIQILWKDTIFVMYILGLVFVLGFTGCFFQTDDTSGAIGSTSGKGKVTGYYDQSSDFQWRLGADTALSAVSASLIALDEQGREQIVSKPAVVQVGENQQYKLYTDEYRKNLIVKLECSDGSIRRVLVPYAPEMDRTIYVQPVNTRTEKATQIFVEQVQQGESPHAINGIFLMDRMSMDLERFWSNETSLDSTVIRAWLGLANMTSQQAFMEALRETIISKVEMERLEERILLAQEEILAYRKQRAQQVFEEHGTEWDYSILRREYVRQSIRAFRSHGFMEPAFARAYLIALEAFDRTLNHGIHLLGRENEAAVVLMRNVVHIYMLCQRNEIITQVIQEILDSLYHVSHLEYQTGSSYEQSLQTEYQTLVAGLLSLDMSDPLIGQSIHPLLVNFQSQVLAILKRMVTDVPITPEIATPEAIEEYVLAVNQAHLNLVQALEASHLVDDPKAAVREAFEIFYSTVESEGDQIFDISSISSIQPLLFHMRRTLLFILTLLT